MKALKVMLLTTLIVTATVQAENKSVSSSSHSKQELPINKMESIAPTASQEIIILTEQNKLIKEYQGSLLNTVYWSLTGIFTLAALLSGFGWWSNFRVYEADKKRLKDEFDTRIRELESASLARETLSNQKLSSEVDSKVEGMSNRVSTDLIEIRREIAQLRIENTTSTEKTIASSSEAEKKLSSLEKSIAIVEYELRHVEEHVWELKGVISNVLITQGQAIGLAAKTKDKHIIENVMERMKKTIEEKIISKNIEINDSVIELIQRHIGRAKNITPIESEKLLDIISNIKIKK